jgi:glucose/arabinose dehydrogenase
MMTVRLVPIASAAGSAAATTAAIVRRTLSFVVVMAHRNPTRSAAPGVRGRDVGQNARMRPRAWPIVLGVVMLAACGTPPTTPAASAPRSAGPYVSAPATASATPRHSPTPSTTLPPVAIDPPPLTLEPVSEGLANPIGVARAPGEWLLVNEQTGRVVAVQPGNGEQAVVADLRDRVSGDGGERGLLGLVLHPDWPDDARAFVHYSDRDGDTVLAELSGSQDGDAPPVLDPGSEHILLAVDQPYPNHNGGQLEFGPDGYLWMGLGDGGSGGDPHGNGQNPATLLGDILRLDVSRPGGYTIPEDNPYADGEGGASEVYLTGLRNPWRFSFDQASGALWIADVGQGAYEEIDRLDPAASPGANLGWNVMEGTACFAVPDCSAEGLILPLAQYAHDLGCSVTGGYVYRGAAVDGLSGWYLYSDYCSGLLFGTPSDAVAPADGSALAPRILLETGQNISSFGVDEAGELYVTDISGGVLSRIVGA